MFSAKSANDPFSDPNMGAGSLEYMEVRAKTEPSDHFTSSANMVFDFNVGQGKYALLNESYFEVQYKVGRIKHGDTKVTPLATSAEQAGTTAAADYDNSGDPTGNEKITIALQTRFLNHCLSNLRHIINGVQVAQNSEPAASQTFKDTQMSSSYDDEASSAFYGQSNARLR